jgi:hypothetical protein
MAWVGFAKSFTFVFSRAVRRQNENLSSTFLIAGTTSQINLKPVNSNPVLPQKTPYKFKVLPYSLQRI